jgi:hypothetical protein
MCFNVAARGSACYVHVLDVPLCGGTAFDVRAGLFAGSGLTDKIQTLRSSLYGGKFTSYIDKQLSTRYF